MDRTIYQDGVEVQEDDLNNTEATKADAIKVRMELLQHGSWNMLVTERDAIGNGHVDIGWGKGYCANGEQIISYFGEQNVALVTSDYNFVILVYVETESRPFPHEQSDNEYNTRVTEGYSVEVLQESAYNALSQEDKDNRIVVGIVKKESGSLVIQTSRDFNHFPVGETELDINGMKTGMYSIYTPAGEASFDYQAVTRSIRYKAPGDSWGAWVTLNANFLEEENYKLFSGNVAHWVWIEVIYPIIPNVEVQTTITIRDLYEPEISPENETPTGSAVDALHRGMHLLAEDPMHGPAPDNPHGIPSGGLTGGLQGDVVLHQDLMHCNGIIDVGWFLNQKNPIQEWNKWNWNDGIFVGDMVVDSNGDLTVRGRGEGRWVIVFDSGKDDTVWQRISMEAELSSAEEAEIGVRVCAATTEQKALSKWWSCDLSFMFPDEVSADLTWDNVVGRWLFLDVWMSKGRSITWLKAEYDKGEQSQVLKPICDEASKKITILELGEAHYVIKGIVFEEVDETFPWEYTFPTIGVFYVVLGGDKKFHIFENSYDTENYIPIAKVSYGASEPILWVKYTDTSQYVINVSTAQGSSPASVTFSVLNAGAGSMQYWISNDSAWISCTPISGTQEGSPEDTITVTFSTDTMNPGTYLGEIHVEAGLNDLGTPQTIQVNLTIT